MSPVKPKVVLIDYGLACVMMPTTLAGSQIGTQLILNTFPSLVIQVLLVGLLAFLSWNALTKAVAITRKENREKAEKLEQMQSDVENLF